ncbi:MAG: HAD-IIB family hydrolase [Anaerolineae bacterium]|nr:HAD-IIB family hydrolase [Anaerolineae bacterium]
MQPIRDFPPAIAQALLGVFFDIDDTFTTHGKIHPEPFRAIWSLKEAGLRVVPITGRPAGWCDHIARMWPVDGVVGENGALYFWYDLQERKVKRRFVDPDPVRQEKRRRLALVREEILRAVSGAAVAGDQPYREADLAIDYCEDVAPLPWEDVKRICDIFRKHGATYKVSSIHVNGWFGDYNKLGMTQRLAQEQWGLALDDCRDRFIFCGDSPNDEPMFEFFPHAIGVNNLLNFAEQMQHLPAYIAGRAGGEGFAEIVGTILQGRTSA